MRAPANEVQSRLESDLGYLASPALRGRLTGTPGNDSAAAFIGRRYAELGLRGVFADDSCRLSSQCSPGFFQEFRLGPGALDELDVAVYPVTRNVAALVIGTDSALRREYVLVGAHYDHIGMSKVYALDPGPFALMHLGADDNASGTAAVMELARRLAAKPTRRSVLFVNFSAEEEGLLGSQAFVEHSPIPMGDVITMVNLDMVGRLNDNSLILFASGADDRFHHIVDSVERVPPILDFRISWRPARSERSDLIPFADNQVPVIAPFTDYHADYHRAGDIAARINFEGLEKVVDLTERTLRAIADGNSRPEETSH